MFEMWLVFLLIWKFKFVVLLVLCLLTTYVVCNR
jgi:hypothetical protein